MENFWANAHHALARVAVCRAERSEKHASHEDLEAPMHKPGSGHGLPLKLTAKVFQGSESFLVVHGKKGFFNRNRGSRREPFTALSHRQLSYHS